MRQKKSFISTGVSTSQDEGGCFSGSRMGRRAFQQLIDGSCILQLIASVHTTESFLGFSAHTVAATIQSSRNYDDERKRIPTYRTTLISILGARGWVVLLSSRFRKASPGPHVVFLRATLGRCFLLLQPWEMVLLLHIGKYPGQSARGRRISAQRVFGVTQLVTAIVLFHLFSALTAREGVGSSWRGRRLRDAANKGVDLLVPLYALFCTILAVLLKQKRKEHLPSLLDFLPVLAMVLFGVKRAIGVVYWKRCCVLRYIDLFRPLVWHGP